MCPAATTPSSSMCCTASTPSSRTACAPRSRWARATSKTWVVNCGWVLAANLAVDLAAWCRLLGLYDCDDLKDAEPDTLRRSALEPARPAGPPCPRPRAEDQPDLALEGGVPGLLAAAVRPARTRLTRYDVPATRKGDRPGAVGAGEPDTTAENRHKTISN